MVERPGRPMNVISRIPPLRGMFRTGSVTGLVPQVRRTVVGPARIRARQFRDRRRRLAGGPVEQLAGRLPVAGVLLATGVAGLLFGPVFGSLGVVLVPTVAVLAVSYLGYEGARAWAPLERWRAWLTVLLGLLVIVETTLRSTTRHGLPAAASIQALYAGARRSWLLTLQSTLPARPEPRLVVFVPLLVLAAAVIALQVVGRTRVRLPALLPSLVVAVLAQAYHPMSVVAATPAVLGYSLAAALALGVWSNVRSASITSAVAVPAVVGCMLAGAVLDPAGRQAYSLSNMAAPVPTPTALTNPLDEIAYRLEHPQQAVFTVRGAPAASLWPVAVFDTFDGTNWGSTGRYRYLGRQLTGPTSVPTSQNTARIEITGLPGPWVPSQHGLRTVAGIAPLVNTRTGSLLYAAAVPGTRYELGWRAPDITGRQLARAPLAAGAGGGVTDPVPADIVALARTAVRDAGPSVSTALVLERYLRQHYRLAVGRSLPAGHSWPQLERFLSTNGRVGTTEQFASAYVVMARVLGIPARLAVGFRQPAQPQRDGSYVVRNADVLAWPEIAVAGVGWVPLDPSGIEHQTGGGRDTTPLARATDQARADLPPPRAPKSRTPPKPPTPPAAAPPPPNSGWPVAGIGTALLIAMVVWVLGIPLAKELRAGSRRRRTGNAAVVSAWLETRDRLRDHGVPVARGMTVRDVASASRGRLNRSAEYALEQLASLVDAALWSGGAVNGRGIDLAWQACDSVRHSLAAGPPRQRIVGWLGIRSLRRLR